jgi:ankyrin repeat protein
VIPVAAGLQTRLTAHVAAGLQACLIALAVASLSAAPVKSEIADAAQRGDVAGVRALIAKKVNVSAPQNDGSTALHWAVQRGNVELINLLVRAGANVKAATREGVTPLWLASVNGDATALGALLEAGADPNEKLPLGRTPLMIASRTGNVAAMAALLDKGADANAKDTLRGTTPIMWAADEGHAPAVKLLVDRGADIKARSNPAPRGRGPALGKANDPRKQVAAQGEALARGRALDLGELSALGGGRGIGGGGGGGGRGGAAAGRGGRGGRGADGANFDQDDAAVAAGIFRRGPAPSDGGQLTPLVYAVRANDVETVKVLLAAGADVNQTTGYGWSPLLVATQNRYYALGKYLLEHGANPNLGNKGDWVPLYIATDNRNIESGDYPVRKGDMDHLDFIKLLIDKGANVNARVKDSTETRTVFTNQWLDENGATAFLRASQSGDVELMKLLIELGVDVNLQADTGRTALHGAAHKGRADVIQILADHGAKLDVRDYGNTDNRGGKLAVHTWQPVDYADGLVRVGVQSAIPHPEAGALLRKLMTAAGMQAPPMGRTLESICITEACD